MALSTVAYGRVTWTNIVHPTEQDIRQLAERYPQFHALNLNDCLTDLEFPKVDHHDDYLFLVVQFPIWEEAEHSSRPAEVDIFISRGVLVTSHRAELQPLVDLFAQASGDEARRQQLLGRGASPLLYDLLNALVDYCYPMVHAVDTSLRQAEQNLFKRDSRVLLNEIAMLRRSVIAMRRILKPQLELVAALEQGNWPFIHEDLDLYWSDLGDHLRQLTGLLDEHAEVVDGLSDTIDTLASHRIDEVIRLLTVVTILTLPLTVLSTVFSMNVRLPFEQHPLMFYSVVGIGSILTAILLWVLIRRRWL